MKRNKVGGCDGLILEFYLYFWEELKVFLDPMYELVLKNQKLGLSAGRGIISLLPKIKQRPKIYTESQAIDTSKHRI